MTPRAATDLRDRLVQAAQESFHEHGYHGSGMESILQKAECAKGSLYHHFSSKEALAEAVIAERLMGFVEGIWGRTQWHDDPISFLQARIRDIPERALERGCPVNSLAQEVAFAHTALRRPLADVFDRWTHLIARGLTEGVRRGRVDPDIDAAAVAAYYLAAFEGLLSLAKVNRKGPDFVRRAGEPLVAYLEGLRFNGPARPQAIG